MREGPSRDSRSCMVLLKVETKTAAQAGISLICLREFTGTYTTAVLHDRVSVSLLLLWVKCVIDAHRSDGEN